MDKNYWECVYKLPTTCMASAELWLFLYQLGITTSSSDCGQAGDSRSIEVEWYAIDRMSENLLIDKQPNEVGTQKKKKTLAAPEAVGYT